jgi:cysteine sulfinate desulfinase/cysteine desulfurase-like protein
MLTCIDQSEPAKDSFAELGVCATVGSAVAKTRISPANVKVHLRTREWDLHRIICFGFGHREWQQEAPLFLEKST